MSGQPRRLFLIFALLVVGAVLGHAAEHEGWIKGIFHCDTCEHCPESESSCSSHSHDHAQCECQGHLQALLPIQVVSISPSRACDFGTGPVFLVSWVLAPSCMLATPAVPPLLELKWVHRVGCLPLLI